MIVASRRINLLRSLDGFDDREDKRRQILEECDGVLVTASLDLCLQQPVERVESDAGMHLELANERLNQHGTMLWHNSREQEIDELREVRHSQKDLALANDA